MVTSSGYDRRLTLIKEIVDVMKNKRVVVTGFSVVTPIGIGNKDFWSNHVNGYSGVKKINSFTIPENMSQIAGVVDDFDVTRLGLEDSEVTSLDRSFQFALTASKKAVKMAGLCNIDETNSSRYNVHIATAISNIEKMEKALAEWSDNGKQQIPRKNIQDHAVYDWFNFDSVSKIIAKKLGFQGEHSVIATGCTGGVDAVGFAFQMIRDGEADVVLTGSTEAPITPLVVSSFSKINATSRNNMNPEKASRPFDLNRDGFVLAEGCGILILESLEHALNRNADIYAEVLGYGSCNNAIHMTDIPEDGESIAKSIQLSLVDAGVNSEEIDFVNLHGSSTKQNDFAETEAMKKVFGERYQDIPVTSVKSQVGHALSASNSIEIVSSIMSLSTGIVPPTINLENKDPKCDLNVVTDINKQFPINKVLKISSGFSGIHSSLVLGKFKGETNE
ncbi:hypothetical protein COF42_25585 [Bacillus wiedmannii]|nr:hypothetical protein COF42_25585 [Bacillus wiedmannii]